MDNTGMPAGKAEKPIEKIRKLLALAERAGSSEESASAMKKAKTLMEAHDVASSDIDNVENIISETELPDEGFSKSWRSLLLTTLARHSGCEVVRRRRGRGIEARIIGKKEPTQKVTALYRTVSEDVDRLADAEIKNIRERMARTDLSAFDSIDEFMAYGRIVESDKAVRFFKESFRVGSVAAVHQRLKDARRKRPQPQGDPPNGQAPPPAQDEDLTAVDADLEKTREEVRRSHPQMRTAVHSLPDDRLGWYLGYRAGLSIDLGLDKREKLITQTAK